MKALVCIATTCLLAPASIGSAFVPSAQRPWSKFKSSQLRKESQDSNNQQDALSPIWNPSLRAFMAGTASLGVIETAYLTYNKLQGYDTLCGIDASCGNVLNGPYALLFGTGFPLSALGLASYAVAVILCLTPNYDIDDTNNRIALLCVSTSLATFSSFLVYLLFGILHASCPYCMASAILSWTLGACAWFGGCLPNTPTPRRQEGLAASITSFVATSVLAVSLFAFHADASTSSTSPPPPSFTEPQAPPPITKSSSLRALVLAQDLERLDAHMFGAFWCNHCFDQKMTLGKEAFGKVQYIECAKDGINSQTSYCKEKQVPGYPTWEIGGKLYPGEQELDELEEIVEKIKTEMKE